MNQDQQNCQAELDEKGLIPKKYYGQVFTTDTELIKKFVEYVKEVYQPDTKIVEIGGGLGYLTKALMEAGFEDMDVVEFDEELFLILEQKIKNLKLKIKNSDKQIHILNEDILNYTIPKKPYLLVGNIPFHVSGRLYRRFMSELDHKPYGMVFITDKNYAETLAGQPPRCYRVSLQAQAYGNIEILDDVPPTAVYPEPKVMCCILRIMQNDLVLPNNFWETVNYHWENFPTDQVESPKTVGLKGWLELCEND